MPKQFFDNFPLVQYDMDKTGNTRLVINILQRAKMREILLQNYLIFYEHDVRDGETPEILASKLYGSPQYHWVILFANNIVDPYYDWPLSYDNIIETIRKRYSIPGRDGIEVAHQTIHHYEDQYGAVIDETTYMNLPDAERHKVTVYEWEMRENEKKRRIQILEPRYLAQIEQEFQRLMRENPLT